MITWENGLTLSFHSMGLFDTEALWTHPTVTVPTEELILPLQNTVSMFEGSEQYTAEPGQLLWLCAGVKHGGTVQNRGRTSFYWLHFSSSDTAQFRLSKVSTPAADTSRLFREMLHDSIRDPRLSELLLAKFLLEGAEHREYKNKTVYEVREYIRLHAAEPLRVGSLAAAFGYSPDHLSRLYRGEMGMDLKGAIVKARLSHVCSLLVNTALSLKEIAARSGFADENAMIKFFTYHEGVTPTAYRGRIYHLHKNDR